MVLLAGSSFDPLADENLGAMVIGFAISLVLCGVVIIQGYTYYQNFGDDMGFLKALVSDDFFKWTMITVPELWTSQTTFVLCVDLIQLSMSYSWWRVLKGVWGGPFRHGNCYSISNDSHQSWRSWEWSKFISVNNKCPFGGPIDGCGPGEITGCFLITRTHTAVGVLCLANISIIWKPVYPCLLLDACSSTPWRRPCARLRELPWCSKPAERTSADR